MLQRGIQKIFNNNKNVNFIKNIIKKNVNKNGIKNGYGKSLKKSGILRQNAKTVQLLKINTENLKFKGLKSLKLNNKKLLKSTNLYMNRLKFNSKLKFTGKLNGKTNCKLLNLNAKIGGKKININKLNGINFNKLKFSSKTGLNNINSFKLNGIKSKNRASLMAISLLSIVLGGSISLENKAKLCGIVGYIGNRNAANILTDGIRILQNRGYDSAGVATIDEKNNIVTTKFASVDTTSDSIITLCREVPARHDGHKIGIAHTRWATHGGKTDYNAHPHSDHKDRIALCHNGTIENCEELRKELEDMGIKFRSETDSEVIAQLIGLGLDEGMSTVDAVKAALARLQGTWGLIVVSKEDPDQVICARNGSPIVIGIGEEEMFIGSEISAFGSYTNKYIQLNDREVAVITRDGLSLDMSRAEISKDTEVLKLSPDPWPHWTIREIYEQPGAIARALAYGGRFDVDGKVKLGGLNVNQETLMNIHNLVIAACGTSYYSGLYGAMIMRSLNAFNTVQCVDAAETNHNSFPQEDPGLLVISQSGETKDVHRALDLSADLDIPMFSVVNRVGSLIARTTKCGVYLNAGKEYAVASTKAFTTQVTVLSLIAAWFGQNRLFVDNEGSLQRRMQLVEAIHHLPTYTGMSLKSHDQCKSIAQKLKDRTNMFILGKGYAYPIAMEGALKIKEITYIHAEGFGGSSLKHGPFALIEEGTPIILIILNDENAAKMRIAASSVRSRGAYTIVITDKKELASGCADEIITIPSNGPLTALLAAVPLQLLAYEISIARGYSPDKPRNLAKSVTVD